MQSATLDLKINGIYVTITITTTTTTTTTTTIILRLWTYVNVHFQCFNFHKVVWQHYLGEVGDIHTITYAVYF